jgi:Cof subfamily protein (haloacid dehalogenase superfamily)
MSTQISAGDPRSSGTDAATTAQRLVALDIDGTLVDHRDRLSPAVLAAVRDVAASHHVVVATGRSLQAALPVVRRLGLSDGFLVASNGGVTARLDASAPDGAEVVHRDVFDPSTALAAVGAALPSARFALETDTGEILSTEGFQDFSFGVDATPSSLDDMQDRLGVRLVVASDDAPEDFAERIEGIGLHGVTYAVGWSAWLDITAPDVTKAKALERLRALLGVEPGDTVAVGDGRNDIEMLRWAGTGIAMGQGPAEVHAAADRVTGTVHEDGLATALDELGLAARESAA